VTVVAPAAIGLAPTIWTEATPKASVSAVPDAGTIVARVAAVLKVTTVFGTKAPEPSRTVAVTRPGLPALMLLTASPVAGLVRATLTTPVAPLLVAITLKPASADTLAPPTWADAEIVVAPPAVGLAAAIWMEATPKESVSAVPDAGISVAKVAEVLKVTTAFGTTAPEASLRVAVTFAGLPVLIVVTASPVLGLVNAMLIPVAPELTAVTLIPTLPDTGVVPRVAAALMVVAPAAEKLAASTWIVATPAASVRAVPEEGVILTRVAVVVNVTTVFATGEPVVSRTVADSFAGLPMLTLVNAAPLTGSVNVKVMLAATGFEGVSALPLTQPAKPSTPQNNNAAANMRKRKLGMFSRITCGWLR
jgi:hypothetical protein